MDKDEARLIGSVAMLLVARGVCRGRNCAICADGDGDAHCLRCGGRVPFESIARAREDDDSAFICALCRT